MPLTSASKSHKIFPEKVCRVFPKNIPKTSEEFASGSIVIRWPVWYERLILSDQGWRPRYIFHQRLEELLSYSPTRADILILRPPCRYFINNLCLGMKLETPRRYSSKACMRNFLKLLDFPQTCLLYRHVTASKSCQNSFSSFCAVAVCTAWAGDTLRELPSPRAYLCTLFADLLQSNRQRAV